MQKGGGSMNGAREKDRKVAKGKQQLQSIGEEKMAAQDSFILKWTEYGITREIKVFSIAPTRGRRPGTGS